MSVLHTQHLSAACCVVLTGYPTVADSAFETHGVVGNLTDGRELSSGGALFSFRLSEILGRSFGEVGTGGLDTAAVSRIRIFFLPVTRSSRAATHSLIEGRDDWLLLVLLSTRWAIESLSLLAKSSLRTPTSAGYFDGSPESARKAAMPNLYTSVCWLVGSLPTVGSM